MPFNQIRLNCLRFAETDGWRRAMRAQQGERVAHPIAEATPYDAIPATSRDDVAAPAFCSPCPHGCVRDEFRFADKKPGIDAIHSVSTALVRTAAPVARGCEGAVSAAVVRTITRLLEPGRGALPLVVRRT